MNKQIKQKWVTALRSGHYKQGQRQLRTRENEFCCLGVLCNIHAQEHLDFATRQLSPVMYDSAQAFLPDMVAQWAKIPYSVQLELAGMNDEGKSFNQIANYIEKVL